MKRASIPSHPRSPSRSQGRSGRHSRPFYRKPWLLAVLALLILYAGVVVYQTHKPLPPGVSFEGTVHYVPDGSLELLTDLTHRDAGGGQQVEQQIFERMFQAIGNARQFIVLDMFLYNGYANKGQSYPPLSRKMTDKLIEQKKRYPELAAVVITDDVNTSYGSHDDPELELLKRAGIQVSITNVNPLRDSNPLYTAAWRMTAGWFGQHGKGWLPNKMASEAPDMTLRAYLKLVNAKANHRKVLITEKELVLASANAHDSSFYNSNSGYAVSGSSGLIGEALRTEQAALDLSKAGIRLPDAPPPAAAESAGQGTIGVQLLTEGKIRNHVLADLNAAGAGDTVWMGMFYLADRSVVRALLDASGRGAAIRLILDPNEVAFGNGKIGIPNRPVAQELADKSDGNIQIRWYNTDKEQYHVKAMLIAGPEGTVIHNGSSNFTARNLDDLNLESNLRITASSGSRAAMEAEAYFQRLWSNEDAPYTVDYGQYENDKVWIKRVLYRVQDLLGFTTF